MTCAKWATSIFAIAILILAIWPSVTSAETAKWINIISAVVIALIVWTGTICKCDLMQEKKTKKR